MCSCELWGVVGFYDSLDRFVLWFLRKEIADEVVNNSTLNASLSRISQKVQANN